MMAVRKAFAWMELDFGLEPRQLQLNLTFRFLMQLCRVVMVLIAIWAVSAGFVHAWGLGADAITHFSLGSG